MPTSPNDTFIDNQAVSIAAQDFGGDRPPILLLHGGGGSLAGFAQLAPMLAAGHRVVAMDLRGHGRSGDGEWKWEAVLDDVEAVIGHFRLSDPVVVGHSMGGMIAGMWGRRHPEAAGVVSLDGHRSAETDPGHYHGMDPRQRDDDLKRLREMFDAQADGMARPIPAELVAVMPERQLVTREAGTFVRPGPVIAGTLRRSAEFRDSLPVFADVECPFLVVLATRDLPIMPPDFHDLMAAYRSGLRHDLAALASRKAKLQVREIDASHAMVSEAPQHVCTLITDFIKTTGRR